MSEKSIPERLKWWIEARFGMFIHWGLYSILKRGEWVMFFERIPKAEYAKLAFKFKPARFNANEWVALAKNSGMRYMVLTTRHHDGFCLWDSQVSDFTSVKTAAKRDFIAEFVEACRKAGMRIGFYYSLLDWRWPEYWDGPSKNPEGWAKFREYVHMQVRELMANYGKIDVLWYDGAWPYRAEDWQSERLNSMVRSLQPDIIINNRSGVPEDFETPEQHIRYYDRPWESCVTIDESWWGYHSGDKHLKSPLEIVRLLTRCAAGNGNLLFNVGPRSDGSIPEAYARRLRVVGEWLKRNGESIYGAGAAPFGAHHLGYVTAKGNKAYIHVLYWPGREMCVAGIKNKVLHVYMLATETSLPYEQKDDRLFVHGLPPRPLDPINTVLALELDGKPETVPPSFWK